MCAFKLVLTPIDMESALTTWIREHSIVANSIRQVLNVPNINEYYPRLVCFHLKGEGKQQDVWVESLSVNEVHSMIAFGQECTI